MSRRNIFQKIATACLVIIFSKLNGQDIAGRWVMEDWTMTYTKKKPIEETRALKRYSDSLLRESKGRIIHEFRPNGLLYFFSVDNGDTVKFNERRWWTVKNKLFDNRPEAEKDEFPAFDIKKDRLIEYSHIKSLDLDLITTYRKIPGYCKEAYSNRSMSAYFKAGILPLDKKWSLEDYRDAAVILNDLYKKKIAPLPNHNDSSYLILTKLTDYNSMEFLKAGDSLKTQDAYYLASFVVNLVLLEQQYTFAAEELGKKFYSNENAKMSVLIYRLADKAALARNYINKPRTEAQKENALKNYRVNLNQMLDGGFTILLKEFKDYEERDLCLIGQEVFSFYRFHKYELDADQKRDYESRVEQIKNEHEKKCLREMAASN